MLPEKQNGDQLLGRGKYWSFNIGTKGTKYATGCIRKYGNFGDEKSRGKKRE